MMWTFGSRPEQLWAKMNDDPSSISMHGDDLSIKDADFVIVINDAHGFKPTLQNLAKTIFIKMEPNWYNNFWRDIDPRLLKAKWVHGTGPDAYNNIEWHLSHSFNQLMSLDCTHLKSRDNTVSSILSNKCSEPGHKQRLDFALFAQHHIDWDAFGFSHDLPWIRYKGALPSHVKDDALIPYKYSFAGENNIINGYFTEKLIDCILTETLCFYNGPPNVGDFIDERAFIRLDLNDHFKSLQIMKDAINANEWERRLPFIRQAKHHILTHLSMFPRLRRLLF